MSGGPFGGSHWSFALWGQQHQVTPLMGFLGKVSCHPPAQTKTKLSQVIGLVFLVSRTYFGLLSWIMFVFSSFVHSQTWGNDSKFDGWNHQPEGIFFLWGVTSKLEKGGPVGQTTISWFFAERQVVVPFHLSGWFRLPLFFGPSTILVFPSMYSSNKPRSGKKSHPPPCIYLLWIVERKGIVRLESLPCRVWVRLPSRSKTARLQVVQHGDVKKGVLYLLPFLG